MAQSGVLTASETHDQVGSSLALGDFDGDGRAEGFVGPQGEGISTNPRAGTGVEVDEILPRPTSRSIEQYAPTAALQSAPVGTSVAPIRYAYVDNVGGPKIAVQPDPDNVSNPVWDGAGSLEAVFTGKPAVGQTADGKGVVAVRSTRGDVWIRTQTATDGSAPWGPWVNYGGPDVSGITMATLDNGRPAVIGIGARGELAVLPQTLNGRFGAWQGTGIMGLTGDPVAVTVAGGTRIFARDTDGHLHTALYAKLALTGCTTVGDALIAGNPSVVVYPGSRLRVFATTADQALITIGQTVDGAFEPSWTTVQASGVAGPPAAVLDPVSGKITVVARGTDSAIWGATETLQGSVAFGEWRAISGADASTDVTMVPFTGSGGASFLFTYRDQNNVQRVYTARDTNPAALAARGAVRSYTEKSLPKAGK